MRRARSAGSCGGRTSASASGARCARTTARTATPGTTSRTTRRARAPIAGARTASPGSATDSQRLCLALALVERQGPDPQGAAVRPDQRRGQSRRGRQGAVLLSRRHADPLVPEVCSTSIRSANFPTTGWSRRTAGAARTSPSSSCSTPACSTTIVISTCSSNTPRPAPDDILMLVTVHNRGPDAATLHVLPQLWFRNIWSWRANANRPDLYVDNGATIAVKSKLFGGYALHADGEPTLLFCDNDTNVRRLFGVEGAKGYFKDAFHEYLVAGRRDAVNPARHGTKAGAHYRGRDPGARQRARSACAWPRGMHGAPVRRLRPGAGAAPRRGRCVLRRPAGRARRPGRAQRPAPGVRRHDLEQAVLLLRRAALARGRPDPAAAAARAHATAATATGRTSTTPTSSRCRTSGSIPGTPPGISRSTASRSR